MTATRTPETTTSYCTSKQFAQLTKVTPQAADLLFEQVGIIQRDILRDIRDEVIDGPLPTNLSVHGIKIPLGDVLSDPLGGTLIKRKHFDGLKSVAHYAQSQVDAISQATENKGFVR